MFTRSLSAEFHLDGGSLAPSVTNDIISSIVKPKSLILFVTNSSIVSAFC